ncbi:MAG: patatin-like phospholipase family protein [Sphaerochaeta sp.]|nr:patatin-like phospholipase family protein [Sphaerochaeta sp.]
MAILDFFKQKNQEEEQEERYILSIDGGGMRGIIPAVILDKLTSLLEELGDNRPLYAHFDLIAGTSTGGLLALALTAPVEKTNLQSDGRFISYIYEQDAITLRDRFFRRNPAEHLSGTLPFGIKTNVLESLYVKHGKEIFPRNQGRIFSQIFTDKYDSEPLERYLKSTFGEIELKEAVVPVMVMTYDAANGKPFPISSRDSHGFHFWEAGRATSAAPTYFKPAYLFDREEQTMQTLIDGGMIANNPALFAYSEAKKLYPHAKKFHILSLSTASSDFIFKISGSGTGVIGWIDPAKGTPIQKIYACSQIQTTDYIAQDIPDLSYTRVHGTVGEKIRLDDTSAGALTMMKEGGLNIYHQNEEAIRSYAERIAKRTNFDQLTLGPKEVEPPLPLLDSEDSTQDYEMEKEDNPALSSYYSFLSRYNIKTSDDHEEGILL